MNEEIATHHYNKNNTLAIAHFCNIAFCCKRHNSQHLYFFKS